MIMTVQIDPGVRLKADLSADRSSRVELQGGGNLSMQYTPQGDLSLSGRYTLTGGMMKYALPVIPLKEFNINNGSYVEWTGNPMDPMLNLKATERLRASVGSENGQSRMVNFDVSIVVKNRLDNLSLAFEIDAPDDAEVQNQLASMSADERGKQAIAMLATGLYLANSGSSGGGGLNMGSALNSILSSQINALAGNLKNASFSMGVEDHDAADAGGNVPTTVSVIRSVSSMTVSRSYWVVRCLPERRLRMMSSRLSTISLSNIVSIHPVPVTFAFSTIRITKVCLKGR